MKFENFNMRLRSAISRDPLAAVALVAFVVAASLVGVVHEPWADEAQAWLIARDATLHDLLFVLPHAESNPSLWHLILILPAAYLDYQALRIISLLFGTLGVAVFVYFAPFPRWIRLILPFTYFVFFQYTVVARSYSMFALAIFSIAALHQHRFDKPFSYAAMVAFLAYTHSLGTMVSVGLVGMHMLDLVKERRRLDNRALLRNLFGIGIPIGVICFFLFQALPTRHRTLTHRWYLDPDRLLQVLKVSMNENLTGITILSLAVLLTSLFWFWQRRVLLMFLVLITPVLAVFTLKLYSEWHLGILFLVWLLVLWVSFESKTPSRALSFAPHVRRAVLACICVVFGVHVYWTAAVSYADYHGNYSCGRDVARLLEEKQIKERRVYAQGFWSVAALPYLEGKMYYNIHPDTDIGYWTWFERDKTDDMQAILAARPDAIVLGRSRQTKDYEGYQRYNFQGNLYWKDRVKETNHCTVYIRGDVAPTPPERQ